jgi:hypothetical protein
MEDFQDDMWRGAQETIKRIWCKPGSSWEPWQKQLDIFSSVRKNSLTAVMSGNGTGKTRAVAALAIIFMITQYKGDGRGCTVFTTSAGWRELEKVLWPEIRQLFYTSAIPLGLEPLTLEWTPLKKSEKWRMVAIASKDKNNFAGLHNYRVLGIGDEADGISTEIIEAMHGNTVGENDRLLLTGNPHTPGGAFHKCCTSAAWNLIKISCFDHPNIVKQKELYPGMVTQRWIDLMKDELGEGTPAWNSRVDGVFPELDSLSIIPYPWIVKATQNPEPTSFCYDTSVLSADVARSETGDETVIMVRDHQAIWKVWRYRGISTTKTCGHIILHLADYPCKVVAVDDVGVGGGVTDRLKEQMSLLNGLKVESVVPVNAGESAVDNKKFFNRKAEFYWGARELFDPDRYTFHLPQEYFGMISQLSAVRIEPHSSGKIKIEDKEKTRARIKRSPDYADAFALGCDCRVSRRLASPGGTVDLSDWFA